MKTGNKKSFMRALGFILLFVVVSGAIADGLINPTPKLVLHFFGSSTCGECLEIKQHILRPLQNKYPDQLEIRFHDIDEKEGFSLLDRMEEQYGVTDPSPQQLYFPDTVLLGFDVIMQQAWPLTEAYLNRSEKWAAKSAGAQAETGAVDFTEKLKKRFKSFSFLGIVAAGLVDGVNPCAIATIIFLISFLAAKKRSRREILMVGLSFTTAVFFTYLLLGMGAFKAMGFLSKYRWISLAIRWSAVALAGIVGLYSFRDAFMYRKSGKSQDIKLQLPMAIKQRIHSVIRDNLTGSQLALGAAVTGFLVTLLEAVCTGQVYLPTIVLMTKQQGTRITGWMYLVLYNVLFVMPLLLIMLLSYFGLTWDKLAKTSQKNLFIIKITFGIVLIGLAVFLAIAG